MPSLNFNKFPKQVESGEKTQTIRRVWKRPIKAGDRLIFFTRLRTEDCRKLGEGVCTEVIPIKILQGSDLPEAQEFYVFIDGRVLWEWQVTDLAKADGFNNTEELFSFFKQTYGLPFAGVLIKWEKK